MNYPNNKNERTALIIGISNGVVQQTALALAKQGFFVIYVDCRQALCDLLKQKLLEQGSSGWGIHSDYWDIREIKSLFNQLKACHGKLDLVITHLNLECESLNSYQDSQLVALCIHRAFTLCAESWLQLNANGGVILNILPVKSRASSRTKAAYLSAGSAITNLSDKFSNDCVPYGIYCSAEKLSQNDERFAKEKANRLVNSIIKNIAAENVPGTTQVENKTNRDLSV